MKKLGEISTIKSGSTPLRSNRLFYDNGNILWVKTTDLNNSFILDTEEKITEYAKARINPVDSVLVAMYGGFNQIGRTGYLKVPAATNQALSVLNANKNELEPLYLLIWLNAKVNLWKEFAGSSRKDPNITGSDVAAFPIAHPTLSEQQKIASFFSLIDERIQTQIGAIEGLKLLKNAVSKKIFSRQLRFKDIDGNDFPEWEIRKLGDLGTFFSGGTPLTSKKDYFDGNIPFIKSGEIQADYTEQFISEEGLKNSSAKMIEVGDLIYALYGATSGEVGISKIRGAINQAILCIRTNMDNIFLLNHLRLQKDFILKTYLQGGQGNLSAEIIKSLEVPFPCIEEQNKIANSLSSIDAKIDLENNLLEKLQEQKKYLLQNMFI